MQAMQPCRCACSCVDIPHGHVCECVHVYMIVSACKYKFQCSSGFSFHNFFLSQVNF